MSELTLRQVLATITEALVGAGYTRGEDWTDLPAVAAELRVFEDRYGIVALAAFERWRDLVDNWREAQARVSATISNRIGRNEPKAWEGYLVLVTADAPPPDSEVTHLSIQYDTSLLRKLVGSGATLNTIAEVERLIAPLLPLSTDVELDTPANLLNRLPDLLGEQGIDPGISSTAIRAFIQQESIPTAIHRHLWPNED